MSVKLGLGLPQMAQYDLTRDVADIARTAERTGYDSLWVLERVLVPRKPREGLYGVPGLEWPDVYRGVADPLTVLTLAAAATDRVRLAGSVLVSGLHAPFPLARSLATLDAASGGRVVAGFGTGWSTDEYRAAGVTEFARRGAQLDELLDICAAVWGPDPVAYEGSYSSIAPADVGPKPARPIPVYLAASGGPALARVARRADGWLPVGLTGPQLRAQLAGLRELTAAQGRDPESLGVSLRGNVRLGEPLPEEGRAPFTGSTEQIAGDVAAVAEAGAQEVLLDVQSGCRDAKELADRAEELYSAVRAAGA
ncbi:MULTISPECIES: LLM class F420-dependent oxidoreductase [Streptomyces]|uniref:LLM class F420-dependent oxidoreductase n=1 Tax=Streptomyces lycii TaxID=2654337 RepID=A0ABQ7FKJ6_9ACTN|nr:MULTISPECIES: LLM class F420-dependent oxidoreductase [Streptomyces]KAF4407752.1 LLM class F420-dependent oxidoreductase [Streptomyces lycii]PGH51434.1 LLM class F420-dependent oxidoreductase [Streptomyces sp. Ru87]